MRLVNNDGETTIAVLVTDFIEDEGKLLNGGNNDFLAGLDELAEVAGVFRMADRFADLGELLYGGLDLLVEDAAIGDDDDGIENG